MLTGKDPPLQNRTESAAEAIAFNCKAEWGGGVLYEIQSAFNHG